MRAVLLAISCWFAAGSSWAQHDVRPDTLDWRRYHPLEVGNVWEWRTSLLVAYEQLDLREIIGDTLIDGIRYYVQAGYRSITSAQDPATVVMDTLFIRYDSTGTRIVARSLTRASESPISPNLGAGPGSNLPADPYHPGTVEGGSAGVVELAAENGAIIPYKFWKSYCNLGGCLNYFHGVGPLPGVGDGAAGSTVFTYLRIGGVEYGSRAVRVDVEVEPQRRPARVSVYPNPARQQFWVDSVEMGSQVTLFDAVGRSTGAATTCASTPCGIDVSTFPAGRYVVRVDEGSGRLEVVLVVVR